MYIKTITRFISISSTTTSSLRPYSYQLISKSKIRKISTSSKANHSTQSSFSDRVSVIGLLTLTTLVGFGFGLGTKSSQFNSKTLEQNPSFEKSTSTTKTDEIEDTNDPNGKDQNESNQTVGVSPSSDESDQAGAYNPETGEINWDCPCLGGMAHGSCGDQFKAAFSCFVYSEQEPKGVECIEKFKLMQECFKDHPDEYAPELADNDELGNEEEGDLSAHSSEDGVTSLSASDSLEGQTTSQDRELTPNRPDFTKNQDDEPHDRPSTPRSQAAISSGIRSNSPDSTLHQSAQIESDGKSSLL